MSLEFGQVSEMSTRLWRALTPINHDTAIDLERIARLSMVYNAARTRRTHKNFFRAIFHACAFEVHKVGTLQCSPLPPSLNKLFLTLLNL